MTEVTAFAQANPPERVRRPSGDGHRRGHHRPGELWRTSRTEDDGKALRDYGAAVVEYGIIDEEAKDYDARFAN